MGKKYKDILKVHLRSDLLLRCVPNELFVELPYADSLYSGRNRVKYQFDELRNPSKERAVLRTGSLKYHYLKKLQGKSKDTMFTKKRSCVLFNKNTKFVEGIDDNCLGFLFDDTLVGRKQYRDGTDKYIWEVWPNSGTNKAFWLNEDNNLTPEVTKEKLKLLEDSSFTELLRPLSLHGLLGIICKDTLENRLMMLKFYIQEMNQNSTGDKLQLPILPLVICCVNGETREYKLEEIIKDLKTLIMPNYDGKDVYDIAKLLKINTNLEPDLMVDEIIKKYKPYSTEANELNNTKVRQEQGSCENHINSTCYNNYEEYLNSIFGEAIGCELHTSRLYNFVIWLFDGDGLDNTTQSPIFKLAIHFSDIYKSWLDDKSILDKLSSSVLSALLCLKSVVYLVASIAITPSLAVFDVLKIIPNLIVYSLYMCTGSRIIKNVETDDKTTNPQLNTDINSNKTKTYRCDETNRCVTLGFDHKKKNINNEPTPNLFPTPNLCSTSQRLSMG